MTMNYALRHAQLISTGVLAPSETPPNRCVLVVSTRLATGRVQ